jgi:SAM-dependent methyltransferase
LAFELEPELVGRDLTGSAEGQYKVFVCSACGTGTTSPFAGPDEIAGFYSSDYSPYVSPHGLLALLMRIMQRVRNRRFPLVQLRQSVPGTLLDVGCGRGDLVASWVDAGGKAIGVEPSVEACETVRLRGTEALVGTLDTVTLNPESVDVAVFRHSLEHVFDPREDLRRVYAALRPGGRVAVIVPNWESWQRHMFGNRWFPLGLPEHRTHFSAAGLHAALEDAGFSKVVVRPATPFITTAWSLQLWLFGRCFTEKGAARWAGYLLSVPLTVFVRALDLLFGDGDFLHALGEKPLVEVSVAGKRAEQQRLPL